MAEPSPTLDPNIGRVIAEKYRIVAVLGAGGAGTVYRAMQVGLERPVALKILNRDLVANPTAQARFRREARAASRLDHPNSVRVFDFGTESDDTTYLAMELIDGRDLYRLIYDEWPHSAERIVHIAEQVLSVLAAAHDLGIVHRDLKPENIMLVSRRDDRGAMAETVKVTDFGIAKTYSEMGEESMKLTQAGTVHGTPEYMAPEQARGEDVDGRADLYSCGVILYEMMTGSLPFTSDNAFEVLMQHMSKPVEPPTVRRPAADARLEPVVMKALAKSKEGRFEGAREMRDALLGTLREPSVAGSSVFLSDRPTADPRAFALTVKQGGDDAQGVPMAADPIGAPDAGGARAADVTAPLPAAVPARIPTERIAAAGDDDPIDASIIGVRKKPYAFIALFLAVLIGGALLVARFAVQGANESSPVPAAAVDAGDGDDDPRRGDAFTAPEASVVDARVAAPPRRTITPPARRAPARPARPAATPPRRPGATPPAR